MLKRLFIAVALVLAFSVSADAVSLLRAPFKGWAGTTGESGDSLSFFLGGKDTSAWFPIWGGIEYKSFQFNPRVFGDSIGISFVGINKTTATGTDSAIIAWVIQTSETNSSTEASNVLSQEVSIGTMTSGTIADSAGKFLIGTGFKPYQLAQKAPFAKFFRLIGTGSTGSGVINDSVNFAEVRIRHFNNNFAR